MIRGLRAVALASALMLGTACVMPPPPPAEVVYVRRAPPARRVEVVRAAPASGMVWIGGYWTWRHAEFIWTPGRWARAPRGYHEWVNGRWYHNRHGWYFISGSWR